MSTMNSPQQRDELRQRIYDLAGFDCDTAKGGKGCGYDNWYCGYHLTQLKNIESFIQSQISSAAKEAEARPFINLDNGFYELNAMQITVSRDKFGNKTIKYMIPYATEQFLLQQSKQKDSHDASL